MHHKRYHTRQWMTGLALSATIMASASGLYSYADCQQHASKAKMLLTNFKQSALKNEHPNSDQFKAEFEPLINTMQSEHCLNELMKIFQFVQAEQQLYPAPGSMPSGFE